MAEAVKSVLVLQPLSASGALVQSALPLIAPYVVQVFSSDPPTASENCLIVGHGRTERDYLHCKNPMPEVFAMHQGLALGRWFAT